MKLALSAFDEEAFDPLSVPSDILADRLETSAMAPHPARAMRQALRADCDNPQRDILLLTHPRCWTEPELIDSLDLLKPGDRCFALFVNEDGSSELAEWRGEGLIRVRKFKVDLDFPEPKEIPATTGPQLTGWTGDIEPIGFPFRPGLVAAPIGLCFDAAGEHVVVLGKDGVLQLAKLDGSPVEVLPRPAFQGHVFTAINTVGGVANGFAACGMMYLGNDPHVLPGSGPGHVSGFAYAAAYYDLKNRTVKVHPVASLTVAAKGWFFKGNCVSLKAEPPISSVLVLGQGDSTVYGDSAEQEGRKKLFQSLMGDMPESDPHPVSDPNVFITRRPFSRGSNTLVLLEDNRFHLSGQKQSWQDCHPMVEGKPLLATKAVDSKDRAQFAGGVLAWAFNQITKQKSHIHFFKEPGIHFAEHELPKGDELFHLSPTGKHIAIQKRRTEIDLFSIADGIHLQRTLDWACLHNNLEIEFGDSTLTLRIGTFFHVFVLQNGFAYNLERTAIHRKVAGIIAASATEPSPVEPAKDAGRFRKSAVFGNWIAIPDVLGQVLLMNRKEKLIAHIAIRLELAAIVLPDGTKWGSPVLLGGPPSPDAEKRITEALRAARL